MFQSSSGRTGSLSPTAPGGPIRWSPHSESGGGSPMYTPLQPTSPSSPLSGMLLFLQSHLQSLFGLPDVDLAAAAAARLMSSVIPAT